MGMKASEGVWVSEPGPDEQDRLTAETSARTKHEDTENAKNRTPKRDSEDQLLTRCTSGLLVLAKSYVDFSETWERGGRRLCVCETR